MFKANLTGRSFSLREGLNEYVVSFTAENQIECRVAFGNGGWGAVVLGPLWTLEAAERLAQAQAMTELAQAHGIKVILCSVMPISDYTARKQSPKRPPADILKLNDWSRAYAAKSDSIFADYFRATVDDKGMLKDGFSRDGLHPNEKGYELLAPVAEEAIKKALR